MLLGEMLDVRARHLTGRVARKCMQPILCQTQTFAPVKCTWPLKIIEPPPASGGRSLIYDILAFFFNHKKNSFSLIYIILGNMQHALEEWQVAVDLRPGREEITEW